MKNTRYTQSAVELIGEEHYKGRVVKMAALLEDLGATAAGSEALRKTEGPRRTMAAAPCNHDVLMARLTRIESALQLRAWR